jgi:hypothetical protein
MTNNPSKEEMALVQEIADKVVEFARRTGNDIFPMKIGYSLFNGALDTYTYCGMWDEAIFAAQLTTDLFDNINEIDFPIEKQGGQGNDRRNQK